MATAYPGGLDNFTNPTASDTLNSATVPHAEQHANANDAIEAIETELGTNPSGTYATVTARLDDIGTTVTAPVTNSGSTVAPVIGINASSADTANYVVQRDANQSFSIGAINFDTLSSQVSAAAKLYWDGQQTLNLGLGGGNVSIALGQEVISYVTNAEATTLAVGEVVYLYGAQGDRPTVKRASNASDSTSSKTFGIVAESIAAGGSGFVMNRGVVQKVNTAAFNPGDILWLGSTPGTFTTTKPVAPAHLVFVGVVLRSNSGNGLVFVSPQNGYELDELHDVKLTTPTNGEVLTYDSAQGLWVNAAPAGDITAVNVSAPITGGGTSGDVTIGHANSGVNAGYYGGAATVPTFTVDAKGHLTSAVDVSIAVAPSQVTGTAVITTDSRLSDARTPTAHAASHGSAGSDPVTLAQSQVTNLTTDLAGKTPTTRTISTTAPLAGGGDLSANRTLTIADATTSVKGAVQLTDSVASTSTTTAATPNSVKTAYDTAAAAVPVSVLRQFLDFDTSTIDTVVRKNAYGSMTPTTNYAYWIMFTPIETITVSSIRMSTQATAAAGTTSCRFGLYTVGTWTGSALPLTLVARTANDTTIFNATYSVFQRSFNTTGGYPATYTLQAGTRYAVGLQMTATTMPIISCVNAHGTTASQQPIIAMIASGQTDLPATINASTAHYQLMWGRLS